MRTLFDEYAEAIFTAIISIIVFSVFISSLLSDLIGMNMGFVDESLKPVYIESEISPVTIATFNGKDLLVQINEKLEYKDRVEAYNSKGEDIKDYITVIGFDSSEVGEKEITYQLNYNGETKAIKAKLIVVDEREEINEKHF